MSYRAEKENQREKLKKLKQIFFFLFIFLVVAICVLTSFYPAASWKYYVSLPKVEKRQEGELRLHFIGVGQGDCTLVEFPDGKTMLVDGGSPYGASVDSVMRYLNALKIKRLDYVVLTGTKSNRLGALSEIAAYKKIGYVYFPKVSKSVSDEYLEFSALVGRESIPSAQAKRYLKIAGEGDTPYQAVFLMPYSSEGSSEAGSSTLWIEWQGFGALLCGDMTAKEEEQLLVDEAFGYFSELDIHLDEQTYLLRMGNSGKATAYTQEFLAYLRPQATVISCLESASFTPDAWAIPSSSKVYRTDLSGVVVASITKDGLAVNAAK